MLSHRTRDVRSIVEDRGNGYAAGETLRFDFDTWLSQNYGLKAKELDKKALGLARKEYKEEYPEPGEGDIKLKTYPFKKYLDQRQG